MANSAGKDVKNEAYNISHSEQTPLQHNEAVKRLGSSKSNDTLSIKEHNTITSVRRRSSRRTQEKSIQNNREQSEQSIPIENNEETSEKLILDKNDSSTKGSASPFTTRRRRTGINKRLKKHDIETTSNTDKNIYTISLDQPKILSKYTTKEATILCDVILNHIRSNTLKTTVLDDDISPSQIDWNAIAKKITDVHELNLNAIDCQKLWKYLAYGSTIENDKQQELAPPSDSEDYERTSPPFQEKKQDITPYNNETETLQLFPHYTLSKGLPSEWENKESSCEISLNNTLPLPFVARKFLKRKSDGVTIVQDTTHIPASTKGVSSGKKKPGPKPKKKEKNTPIIHQNVLKNENNTQEA